MENILREKRETLYQLFEKIKSPVDFFNLQFKLAELIIESEKSISQNKNKEMWQFHLDRLYALGDGLAWSIIDRFVIRQLGQYESIRTSLIGQQENYLEFLELQRKDAETDFYIFSDLTRCITIGDIIKVNSHDNISIIECKGSGTAIPTAESLLQGRNGRQFSKALWLTNYLHSGFGKLYQKEKPNRTIEINTETKYHFDLLPSLIDECLASDSSFVQAEKGLLYLAQNLDCEENTEVFMKFKHFELSEPLVAATGRLTENDSETTYHQSPLTFNIPFNKRILIQEVDIQIMGIVDISYLREIAGSKGYGLEHSEDGMIELSRAGVTYKFHRRFLNDILINFMTVDCVIDSLVALFEKMTKLGFSHSEEEDSYLKQRPTTRKELITYLENKFVTVKLDSDGNMIEAYRMNGEKIDPENI